MPIMHSHALNDDLQKSRIITEKSRRSRHIEYVLNHLHQNSCCCFGNCIISEHTISPAEEKKRNYI